MTGSVESAHRSKASLGADDLALLALTLVSGPALLWLGTRWKYTHNALGQVELLIAAGCVVIGLGICLFILSMSVGAAMVVIGHRAHSPRWSRRGWAISPWFMRRILASALGLQLVTAGVAAADGGNVVAPSPAWTSQAHVAGENAGNEERSAQTRTSATWMPLAPEAVERSTVQRMPDIDHTVVEGDSLWSIAATELGPTATTFEIDQRWRQWWRENRATVGENPHLLIPGTVLKTPAWTS